MHFQFGKYNTGIERFHKVLEKYSRVNFIGHAPTWWANIDKNHQQELLYPKTPVTAGGLTERLLSDYPNMFGDTSAGSGLNALTRDPDHAREFLARQQDKLLFGRDCDDTIGDRGKMSGRANTCGPSRAITKQGRGKKNSLRQCEETVAPASLGVSMSIRSPKEKEGSPLSRDNGGRMNIPAV